MTDHSFNPETDLELRRNFKAPPALVWRCWTEPELLKKWFCPRPWQVTHAEIDLRPGGIFRTVMEGPDAEGSQCNHDNAGCWLLVEPTHKLSFTDCLGPGFRPNDKPFMTAVMTFADDGKGGTDYVARALHSTAALRAQHEEMGFEHGWGAAADQLADLMADMQAKT